MSTSTDATVLWAGVAFTEYGNGFTINNKPPSPAADLCIQLTEKRVVFQQMRQRVLAVRQIVMIAKQFEYPVIRRQLLRAQFYGGASDPATNR